MANHQLNPASMRLVPTATLTKSTAQYSPTHDLECMARALMRSTGSRPTEGAEVLVENVALFTRFHAQNSANHFLEPQQVYDINHANMFAWLQSVKATDSPATVVDFVTAVASRLRHVSFSEFLDALHRTAIDIVTRVTQEKHDAVVLVIDGEISKSNTWITLLVWPILAEVVTHLTDDLDRVPPEIADDASKRVFVLHPDDMSYSGQQMGYVLEQVETWKSKLTYLPVVGFMGSAAAEKLSRDNSAFEIPPNVAIIPSLEKVLEEKYGATRTSEIFRALEKAPWSDYYGVWENATLIYFDHKLADRVSIPTKILVDAVSYDAATDTVRTFRVISNCEDAIYKSHTGVLIDPTTQFVDLDDNYTCPKAYYRTLRYVFDDKPLGGDDSVITDIRNALAL